MKPFTSNTSSALNHPEITQALKTIYKDIQAFEELTHRLETNTRRETKWKRIVETFQRLRRKIDAELSREMHVSECQL